MKSVLFIIASALVTAAPALATVPLRTSFTVTPNATSVIAGYTSLITFSDTPGSTTIESNSQNINFSYTGDSGRMDQSGLSPYGQYAAGQTYYFQAPSPQTGGFYGVGGMTGSQYQQTGNIASSATFAGTSSNTDFSSISVYLGSLNSFNVVKLCYDSSCSNFDTFNGLQLNNNVDPNSGINARVMFTALDGNKYSSISFYNNAGNSGSFEFDNLAFYKSVAAVPEPASWAMMIGGFGMVGGALRANRRRSMSAFA